MQGLNFLRSRYFRNLYASYAAVLLVTAVLIGLLIGRQLEASLGEELEATLRSQCVLLGPTAERALRGDEPDLGDLVVELGQETHLRITLISSNGTVLADSDEDPAVMDDHHRRPEIVASRKADFGVSRRYSRTVGYPMLYVARRLSDGDHELGFVRVSLPLRDVDAQIASTRRSVVVGTGIGLLVALALGLYFARRLSVPIAEMMRVAEDLRDGNYESRVSHHGDDELGLLGDTLNRLGAEITHRVASLSQEDAQLRAMLTGMVEGVVAVDEDDVIAFCNGAAREQLGLGNVDPLGQSIWEVAPVAELEKLLADARETRSVTRAEIELLRSGREQSLDAHASPYSGGGRSGIVIVLHDVSDLRRLERVRRDFVANVSHELKTPLTSIKGFVETLLDGAIHEREHNERFLKRIDANVERLSFLVSDLLSLARIESQAGDLQVEALSWPPIFEEVLRRHESGLEERGIECRRHVSGTFSVLGDRESMTQVLDNLVDNAIKYSGGPGRIDLRVRSEGDRGVLEVEDTGPGIPPEDLNRIFERFYRVDKARSREVGGTGLGLSIVKNLVLKMGGEVTAESELGKGTRFTVSLPLAGPGARSAETTARSG